MLNPETLKSCLPGCEKLEQTGEDEYTATMKVGIAAIKGTFSGTVKISDKDEPNSYSMHVEGRGAQGQVSGVAKIELIEQDGATLVRYSGEGNVRGMLARVGARLIQPAAQMVVGQFFECLSSKTTTSGAPAAANEAATS
jgi:carbon monoxide dehydrogenase subunit G